MTHANICACHVPLIKLIPQALKSFPSSTHLGAFSTCMPHVTLRSVHSSVADLDGTSAHGEPPLAIPLMIIMTTSGDWNDSQEGPPRNMDVI